MYAMITILMDYIIDFNIVIFRNFRKRLFYAEMCIHIYYIYIYIYITMFSNLYVDSYVPYLNVSK